MGSITIGVLKRSVGDFLTILKDNFGFLKKHCIIIICLWIKVVCFVLFWSLVMKFTKPGCLDCVLGVFGNISMRRGAWAWFHGVWTCSAKVLEYWTIFSLKIQFNCSWNFWWNWNVLLVLLERTWWTGFNVIYLVRFGFRMWEMLNFKWFLLLKIQINPNIPGFGRKNQLRTR
jgi:hypothetical protein